MLASKASFLANASDSKEDRRERFFAQDCALPLQTIRYGGPDGKLVGCATMTPDVATGAVMLGYYLHPDHQGKGLMAKAAIEALRWAREEIGITRAFTR